MRFTVMRFFTTSKPTSLVYIYIVHYIHRKTKFSVWFKKPDLVDIQRSE